MLGPDAITALKLAEARISLLEGTIREIVSTTFGDDHCWMDVYTKLGALIGIKFDPLMLDKQTMLRQCDRFVTSLLAGCPYATDNLTKRLHELEAENRQLKARVVQHGG